MYATAFDLRPQSGEMVVSRSDVKRRRKEGNILEESLQGSPKRTKVHAQRKFAQGSSNMSSPALTPVKDKDKVKTNGTVLSPELIPAKRPKTEDFLTFLCFRGTPILPPCLDFFNIATVQETPDEEQGSSLGDCSRESTRNSRIASTSVGSSKLQRSADRNVTEASTGSGVIRKFDRSETDGRRKPPTAVQALRRKYQEQRLAKQRASTLKKLAQKVKGKNMVRTRSSSNNEEVRPPTNTKPTKGNIVKKTVRRVKIVQQKIKSTTKTGLLTRMHTRKKTIVKTRTNRTSANSIRRDGLRSGGQLPPGSEAGLKSERGLKQPDQLPPRFKTVVKKKIIAEKSTSKTFASSVSDFSSDDDQPLAKKMKVKPIEHTSSSRQLARKMIKRIVSKRMKPQMITRSQQQQTEEKEQTETRLYTRPPRKTKEAAAIYMELLGRKLITSEAEADEDSLSIDSFPELPNARRIERRESEIKAKASKEKKEALLSKEDSKTLPLQKIKAMPDTSIDKQEQIEIVKVKKLSVRSKRLPLQKVEFSKSSDKVKASQVPEVENKKEIVATKENLSKKQETTDKGQQVRARKLSARLQIGNSANEDGGEVVTEVELDKMRPPTAPRRSLRRGSRDMVQPGPRDATQGSCEAVQEGSHEAVQSTAHEAIQKGSCTVVQQDSDETILQDSCETVQLGSHETTTKASHDGVPQNSHVVIQQNSGGPIQEASSSQNPPTSTVPSKNPSKKTKTFSTSPSRQLRKLSRTHESNSALSEETFSDSDEEPLGKLALKQLGIKKLNDGVTCNNISKDNSEDQRSEMRENKDLAANRKVAKMEGKGIVASKKKNAVIIKAERILKIPVIITHKANDKIQNPRDDGVKTKNTSELSEGVPRSKEMSQRKNEDSITAQNKEASCRRRDDELGARGRELSLRRHEVVAAKNKEKLLRKNEDVNFKNKMLLLKKNDEITKNKEIPLKRSEVIGKNRETLVKRSLENEIGVNKETTQNINEEINSKVQELSLRKTRECVNTKNKDVLKKNEEITAKSTDIVSRKSEDDPQNKRREVQLKRGEDVLPGKKNEEDVQSKRKEAPLKKNVEDPQRNKKETSSVNEGDLEAKEKATLLKDSEENVETNKKETQLKKSADVLTKKKETVLEKNEDLHFQNKEILPRESEDELLTKNDTALKKSEDGKKGTPPKSFEDFLPIKEKDVLKKSKDDLQVEKMETLLERKEVVLNKNKETLSKKNEDISSTKKDEEDDLSVKTDDILVKSGEGILQCLEMLTKKDENDLSNKKKALTGRKSEDGNTKIKEVAQRKTEEDLSSKNKDTCLKSNEETPIYMKKKIDVSVKHKEVTQRNSEDNANRKEIPFRKLESFHVESKETTTKSEDVDSKYEDIVHRKTGGDYVTNKDISPLKCEDDVRIVEVPLLKIEDKKLSKDDKNFAQNTRSKSGFISAEVKQSDDYPTPSLTSVSEAETLTSDKIVTKKELVMLNDKEEILAIQKELDISNKVKIVNSKKKLGNEVLSINKLDITKSSHVLKRKSLQLSMESKTVKLDKETSEKIGKVCNSSKMLPLSNKELFPTTEKKLSDLPKRVDNSTVTKKSEGIFKKSEPTDLCEELQKGSSLVGIKTSPKHALDSDLEDDIVLRKLSREEISSALRNDISTKYEPLTEFPNSSAATKGTKTKTKFEDVPLKQLSKAVNEAKVDVETMKFSHLPSVSSMSSVKGTAITKIDNINEGRINLKAMEIKKTESSSSHDIGLHGKASVVLNRTPTFRDKVKAKVNMSNEQIEKWLNESYIEDTDPKKDCSLFDKNECKCSDSNDEGDALNNIDFMNSSTTKDHDDITALDEGMKLVKCTAGTSYLKEVQVDRMYKSEKHSSFRVDELQQRIIEIPDVIPEFASSIKKDVQSDGASASALSSTENLLIIDERKNPKTNSNRVTSHCKEMELKEVGVMPNGKQRIETRSTRSQLENVDIHGKGETTIEKLQNELNLASQHFQNDLSATESSNRRTNKSQICSEGNYTHDDLPQENTHSVEGAKTVKSNIGMKKQEGASTRQTHRGKSQSAQDRGVEKKSIFQQRRSFLHKIKERKDLTPSANAFSPENESSVYAFETEPELPPISTPFRRRARDSRTSSTTTSKSEEDLARLDDELTPPPSVSQPGQSSSVQQVSTSMSVQLQPSTIQTSTIQTLQLSPIQTVQSTIQPERLTLPVVGQSIQTLPLTTAVVQIIPTLPITMRPVQVQNFVSTQQQQPQQQQQQQQQQLLLLRNNAVMTTLKTGSTSSTSIAVQVNLDNEPSLDTPSQSVSLSDPATPEPLLQRSMECSTQTDVAEEEEDDSEGHLFYIPLQQPPGTEGPLAAPSQQLIQGVAVKLGTEGPTGPNQRVIMRAKLVTKPPNFNRTASSIQDGNALGVGRSVLAAQHQRPAGMLMMEQKSMYGAVGAPATVTTGTYPPVGTVQPIARGRPLVTQNSPAKSDATTDTTSNTEPDALKTTHTAVKTVGISSGLYQQSEADGSLKKPVATVSAKPIDKMQQNTASSMKDPKNSSNQNVLPSSSPSTPVTLKLPASRVQAKERRSSTDTNPASTSRSTSGTSKRGSQKSKAMNYVCKPSNATVFPSLGSPAQMVEAPIFHPTEKEFQDPLEYIDRIRPVAEKFGLCRVVPPSNFKPECKVSDDMRFLAYNQYVHKMLHRWGPNVKEMMAIKKYLATQSISFNHPPWIGGMEVDLPRLYKIVQGLGGLKEVIEKKKWHRVADGMKIPKSAQDRVTKLDDIYCKYLLPYDTLSPDERQKLFDDVEAEWVEKEKRATSLANSAGSDTPEDESEGDASDESEECIVKGRNMPLNAFYRIARNTMSMWFRQAEPPAPEVEQEFWRHVTLRQSHVCVHSGSIDSSGWGYGFPCSKNSPFARHPWNLKVLTNNSGSILRSIGPIMGVTVPTLHVGMLFTTCCWYRDPHGLPWVEYLHTGANKIWYGIPDEYSSVFRSALTKLVPRYCRSKTIWLPSDTAMVPPPMLVKHGVSLCHTVQEPGQFILVFPRAFTSSICTGYLVSESVYFAQPNWLNTAEQVFKDIQNSCEPSMFSLERLLFSIATDGRTNVEVLKQVLPMVLQIRQQELDYRKQLYGLGLKTSERLPLPEANIKRRKARQAREEEGDYECEMCRANLFVSLVTNSHEEGVYCLPHAIELLTKKRHHLKYCKLMYTYDQAELNELIQKLQEKIETKSQRKSQGKHGNTSQKP